MFKDKFKTNSNIVMHRPQSTTAREEEELMQQSSRALEIATDPLEKLRLLCLSRGVAGIMLLGRIYHELDEKNTKLLNLDQFMTGIKETDLDLSDEDALTLFKRFDQDNSGSIHLDELLDKVRPPMSDYRRSIVDKAFKKLDKKEEGVVTIDDIRRIYDPTAFPRYMSGEESAHVVLNRFLENFESKRRDNRNVTYEEFMDFYIGVSQAIEKDAYFDLMMRQCYKL